MESYESIVKYITNPLVITEIKLKYPMYNPRILLSSIIFSKCDDIKSKIVESDGISHKIQNNEFITEKEYHDYKINLKHWKQWNKEQMKLDVECMRNTLSTMNRNCDEWSKEFEKASVMLDQTIESIKRL